MNKALRIGLIVIMGFILVTGGVIAGVAIDRLILPAFIPTNAVPSDAAPQLRLLAEAWNQVQRVYVDRTALEPQKMIYGAIGGMVDALGDTGHSTFLTPAMVQRAHKALQGRLVGIGAYVQMENGRVVIAAPLDGSPAEKAGLRPGDIILAVDGNDVEGLPLSEVVTEITGPAGTSVTLTIQDPTTGQTRDVAITRADIKLINVTWQLLPGTSIAHVRIAEFSQGVTGDLQAALEEVRKQNVSGIILDLRNDPGGLLDEAVGSASQFLPDGDVLLEKDAQGQTQAIPVKPGAVAPEIPLVVLVNHGTASAAEIVTGALQDAGRATVIGETTFGTGTVLQEFPLSDGSALMLAVQEWLTPKGRVIWHKGLAPDIVVELPQDVMPSFPLAERQITAQQLAQTRDAQLSKAISVLTNQ